MSDRQAFVTILGGIVSALFGGSLLLALIQFLVPIWGGHVDGDDDGWGLLWMLFMALTGILGAFLSAKWARKRYSDFQA
jgi:hypothetical protein